MRFGNGLRGHLLAGLGAASFVLMLGGLADAQRIDRSKTIIIAQIGQVNTLDPMRADYAQTNLSDSSMYDTLVTYDYDNKLVGRLATSFKLADDVKSVAITLRPDAKFHDGTPVTAKDVVYTLERLKRLNAGVASLIDSYGSSVVADDTHLTIQLTKPSSLFIGALSKIYIVNSKLVQANAGDNDGQAWLQSHEAGSGPYMLDSPPNPDVIVKLFDGYWDKQPGRPNALVYRRIDESATKRDELLAGNVDVAINLGDRDAAALASNSAVKVEKLSNSQAYIIFNTRSGPTADIRVRKAIQLAYDYKGGLASIRAGNGTIADGPLPRSLACRATLPASHQDLAAAKKLLDDAGIKDLHLTMMFQPVFEAHKQEATLLQSNLKQIGVTVDLQPIAYPNYLASLKNPDSIPQMILIEDFAQYPDPGVMLIKGFKSDAIGTNRSAYSNPQVDKLLDAALTTADENKRCDLYKQAQVLIDQDAPMVDMYTLDKPTAYRVGTITGLRVSPVVSPIAGADLRLASP